MNSLIAENIVNEEVVFIAATPISEPHYRRYTDFTPSSRLYLHSLFPPSSPKMHELLERWELNNLTLLKKNHSV